MMVKTKIETYLPRLRVGASSEVTARAVSSAMPAPAPDSVMPAMNGFILLAVLETMTPMRIRPEPIRETYRRPIKSESDPTNGHTPAKEMR